jgi:NAD(P)H dehydrogenase (quinone)
MTKIAISGASGDLGRRITAELLEAVTPEDLTLVTRTPEALQQHATQGVRVCQANYNDPTALTSAYRGIDVLMLISGLDVTHRVPEHRNAIHAARSAGVRHIVYTSVAGIHPRNPTLSASDHIATESDLRSCGLSYTVLRDATYSEVFPTIVAPSALRAGKWFQVQGKGRLAPVSKADIARCAAVILRDADFHAGATYEITGPELLTFREIAALTAEVYGSPIEFIEVSEAERFAIWDSLGVPRRYSETMSAHPDAHMWTSDELVSAEVAFGQGYHGILSDHVEFITGRKPLSLREVYSVCGAPNATSIAAP